VPETGGATVNFIVTFHGTVAGLEARTVMLNTSKARIEAFCKKQIARGLLSGAEIEELGDRPIPDKVVIAAIDLCSGQQRELQ
jgi:hypothetical protein